MNTRSNTTQGQLDKARDDRLLKSIDEKMTDALMEANRTIAAQAEEIKRLRAFVRKFLGNFEDCTICENGLDATGEPCYRCQGTTKRIDSKGVLYVELPDEARALLETKS
jgi:hypothetical protein